MKLLKWSKAYGCCVECGRTEHKHFGKGLCCPCYMRNYTANNLEKMQEQKHNWYLRAGGKEWGKSQREQRYFGGLREAVLKRDRYECVKCGAISKLVVHHIDGNGRGSKSPNNTMENLETRCMACHVNHHRSELLEGRRAKYEKYWDTRGMRHECVICGRSDRLHQGQGHCRTCYAVAMKKGTIKRTRPGRNNYELITSIKRTRSN